VRPIIGLVVLAVLACCAEGADYYVANQGDDNGPGTSPTAPWRTIARANAAVAPGDTVHIHGGVYREAIAPAASGTEANRITFKAYANEPVTLTGVQRGIVMSDRAYVTVDGIACRQTDEYVYLDNCHHVWITNCSFDYSSQQRGWPIGVRFRRDAHHNRLAHCRIGRVGYSTRNDDKGGVMHIAAGSEYNLIENCIIFYGGHHLIEVIGSRNVIRNNYFHNEEWMNAPHRRETGGKAGNRHVIIDGGGAQNILDGNVFALSGLPPDQDGSAGVSVRTARNIVRRNIFYDNDMAGLNVYSAGGRHDVRFNHIYHNVLFRNAYAAKSTFEPFLCGLSLTKHRNGSITDISIVNNIFWRNRNGFAISFYYCDRARQSVRRNWEEAGPPLFVNDRAPADPLRPGLLDFHLQAQSPCIDAGGFLTRTTAPGQGTAIPVADAGFFTDGFGIVEGDLVQLEGDTRRLRVVQVDYEAGVIHVDAPVAWQAGQGVSQPFNGARPDIGAYEH